MKFFNFITTTHTEFSKERLIHLSILCKRALAGLSQICYNTQWRH